MKRLTLAIIASLLLHTLLVAGISPFVGNAAAHDGEMPALQVRIADATPAQKPMPASLPKPTLDKKPASSGDAKKQAPLPGSYYYKRSELDQPPGTFNDIAPIYPTTADPNGGRVVARIMINEDGKADKVIIEEATPPGQFEQSVIDAFGSAQYRPGMKNGKAVKSQMKIEIEFYPEDSPKALSAPSAKMFKVPTNPDYDNKK